MRVIKRPLVLAFAVLLLLPGASADAASPTVGTRRTVGGDLDATGRYIVVLRKGADLKAVRQRHVTKERIATDQSFQRAIKGFSGKLSLSQVKALRADPDVAMVVPDEIVEVASQLTPTGVARIGTRLSPVAKINGLDERVDADVAVVDTGIDPTHPDLNVAGGINCTTSDPTAWQDQNHHGTHVAGTIGALDNDIGVVGVAPGVRLWAVRILDAGGFGFLSWYICGLDWIASQRDPVDPSRPLIEAVNMSVTKWGTDDKNCGYTNNDLLHQAICRVTAAGITVVAAAANDSGSAARRVPASYDEVITVSALADTDGKSGGRGGNRCLSWGSYDHDDTFADFSNYGYDVDIIAPGKCIWSTYPGNTYGYSSGTSMAAPAVTGAVALYRASRPWTTPAQVRAALQYLGTWNWYTSSDPDLWHEKLLDVSRIGPAGDFNVGLSAMDPLGESGGAREMAVTLDRTPTHFETVALSASVPAGWSATFDKPSLTGFTADTATLRVTVPPSTPAGTYPIGVTASEGPHVHTASRQLVIENDLPTAHAPSAAIAYNLALGATSGPLLVSWPKATDPTSRIAAYEVERSLDYGPWAGTVTVSGAATAARLTGLLGHNQRFRIRAQDGAGNWSEWQVGPALSLGIVQDNSSAMRYTSGWHATGDRWASGGTTSYTTQRGSNVRLTMRARQLAIVGPVARNRGSAAIYVNGVYQGTISFFSRVAASRRVVWTRTFPTDAVRTIELRALGTAGHARVDIDAILVAR